LDCRQFFAKPIIGDGFLASGEGFCYQRREAVERARKTGQGRLWLFKLKLVVGLLNGEDRNLTAGANTERDCECLDLWWRFKGLKNIASTDCNEW